MPRLPRSPRRVATFALALFVSLDFAGGHALSVGASPARAVGHAWRVFLPRSVVRRPSGVAIDLRGAKHAAQWGYVADAGTGRIVKFGTGGKALKSWRYAAPGHPAALVVGGSGNLFVADKTNGNISKFSPAGARLALWTPKYISPLAVPALTDPRGIAVDPQGKIYVAEYTAHTVIQLSPGGTLLQSFDTQKGFTAQYSVPHQNTGSFGDPTGVAFDSPSGHLFVSTVCVSDPACRTQFYTPVPAHGHDVLLVLSISGQFSGWVGNFWFGLGYTAAGTPLEVPGKEEEAYVHIDAIAGDGRGHAFLAGTMWPRGGSPGLAVLSYTDLGYRTGPWRLPSAQPIAGVAVDGSGSVYVAQGTTFLKRLP